jgi:hypothetical protein
VATIITVHGTFASGPEAGKAWWQKGGSVESELRDLVEGTDGRLNFVPHVWDGLNRESSRRKAGRELYSRLDHLEKTGEPYCIVGHSHGGSVVLSALLLSTHRRRALTGLSCWITVGTPFIAFDPKSFLFSRLGLLGKAAYLSLITFEALFVAGCWLDARTPWEARISLTLVAIITFMLIHTVMSWNADRLLATSGAFLKRKFSSVRLVRRLGLFGRLLYVCVLALAMMLVVISMAEQTPSPNRLPYVAGIVMAFLAFHLVVAFYVRWRRTPSAEWLPRWLSLRHSQDEAVEGLRQLPRVSFPIFGKDFAVAPLTFVSAICIPIILVTLVISPDFINWLVKVLGLTPVSREPGLAASIFTLVTLPISWAIGRLSQNTWVTMFFFLAPASFFVSAIVFVIVARYSASVVSRLLSTALDSVAWRQIRASAYGNDTDGEVSLSAGDAPLFIGSQPPLPQQLAAEIGKIADSAAIASLSKLRASVNRLAFAEDERARSDLLSEYLTWDELIHTAYFKCPSFNKLAAFCIAHSEGFRPTARFLADADYARVAAWHAQLTAACQPPASAPRTKELALVNSVEPGLANSRLIVHE